MLLEPQCTGSITNSRRPLSLENVFLLVLLSRIKRSQDILMGKFGSTALNFGNVFFLLIPFFGTHIYEMLRRKLMSKTNPQVAKVVFLATS